VLNLTICYEKTGLSLGDFFRAGNFKCPAVHILVQRVPFKSLPRNSEQELSAWLVAAFKEKDDILQHFVDHGSFPARFQNFGSDISHKRLSSLNRAFSLWALIFLGMVWVFTRGVAILLLFTALCFATLSVARSAGEKALTKASRRA